MEGATSDLAYGMQVSRSQTQTTDSSAIVNDVTEIRESLRVVSCGLKHLEVSKADCTALDARMDSFRKAVEDMKAGVMSSMAEQRAARSGKVQEVCSVSMLGEVDPYRASFQQILKILQRIYVSMKHKVPAS